MEKSYGEIDKRNSQGNNDDISKHSNVVVGHPLPKDEIISDTFKRTVNTHDVQGKIFLEMDDNWKFVSILYPRKADNHISSTISFHLQRMLSKPIWHRILA